MKVTLYIALPAHGVPAAHRQNLALGDALWFTRNDVTSREVELPDRYHRVFISLAESNQDFTFVTGQTFYRLHPESAHDEKSKFAGKVCDDIQFISP